MQIKCPSCGNHKSFLIPLWVRCTFKFNEDGTISILHVKQLESLEEKLTNQGKTAFALTCKECGCDAEVVFNEYEQINKKSREKIKEAVNNHIENLKTEHPELLVTKQWNIIFPKGFRAGHTVLPVVTTSKEGKYLVGEVQFLLPDSLDLDTDALELLLKDEPFQAPEENKHLPPPVDEPLEVLNDIIINVNEFLQSLNLQGLKPISQTVVPVMPRSASKVTPINVQNSISADTIEEIKINMLRSDYLPEWFKTIENQDVKNELLNKLAEGYLHYNKQKGGKISLKEYFNTYTQYLKDNNKLQHYCKYKGKTVTLDSNDFCTETYCSKKPYNAVCPSATLKFGI